ncbi:TPM domain-containing protein [Pendulispora rubella]|uniref:TPM domain-containing protein n=1 Tax=Pendulispora rubella TaxID=2741070 RepID=A0ABZ2LIM2_9BACT
MLGVVFFASPAGAIPLDRLGDPRPASLVLDTTAVIDGASRAKLATLTEEVRRSGRGELVVVIIDNVEGEKPREYATRLFNKWRIGDSTRNDGILILAALQDRKAEIVLGKGLESPEYVHASEEIMQDEMVPRFRSGKLGDALVFGARGCAGRILHATSLVARAGNFVESNAVPLAAGGGIFAIALAFAGRVYLRRRPRRCTTCGQTMLRLGEVQDDAHLSPAERTEEQIGSVDYDVWLCPCGMALKFRYGAFFTKYSNCRRCSAKTSVSSTTTLVSPTEYSEGTAQIDEHCEHCGHSHSYTRSIPRVERRESSSSSSDPWSSFSSSSSNDSGGTSSGSGASGSW